MPGVAPKPSNNRTATSRTLKFTNSSKNRSRPTASSAWSRNTIATPQPEHPKRFAAELRSGSDKTDQSPCLTDYQNLQEVDTETQGVGQNAPARGQKSQHDQIETNPDCPVCQLQ